MREVQRAVTMLEFVKVGFTRSALVGSLASDFWVTSTAAALFVLIEGRPIRIPLFLFMRERLLRTQASSRVGTFAHMPG